jgi:peptide/nickel transport system substrate-binding protein
MEEGSRMTESGISRAAGARRSRDRSTRYRGLVLASLAVLVSAGCSATSGTDEEGDPDTIGIAVSSSLPNLDAHIPSASPVMDVFDNIFEQLYDFEGDGTLVPELAAELPDQVEEGRWRVTLREGVTFHNGEPFDADAAIANIERMTDPETAADFLDLISTISGVERVDDYTIDILSDGLDVVLPSRLSYIRMMAPSTFEDPEAGIGTGPYEVDAWDKASSITLTSYDDYWGETPPISAAKFVFLEEPGTRVAALLSGEVDVIMGLSPDDQDRVPHWANSSDKAVVLAQPNVAEGVATGDVRVRRAMMHAMDRDAIANELYGGSAEVLNGAPIAEGWFGFDPDAGTYEYDPELAADLVREAGAEGEKVRIVYDAGRWPRIAEITQVLEAAWSDIGLDVELDNQPGEAWVDTLLGVSERPEIIMVQTTNEFRDASLTADKYMHPDSDRTTQEDPELARILDAAIATSDVAEREELYAQAIAIMHDRVYSLPIVSEPSATVGMSDRVDWTPGVEARPVVANMSFK